MEEHQFGSDESGDRPRPVLPELSAAGRVLRDRIPSRGITIDTSGP